MRSLAAIIAVLLVAVAVGDAGAAGVYRCVRADGSVIYQDRVCPAGQRQRLVHLADPPPAPAPAAVAAPADIKDPAVVAVPVSVAPVVPAPDFYLCTRHDGSRYSSVDGRGGSTAVPLGMLGFPEQGLAQTYGGKNGAGVSAPGVRPIPQISAAEVPLAGGYIWIDDACHHASAREACAFLRGELDTTQDKLKRAFSDTEAQLKRQQAELRDRLRGC